MDLFRIDTIAREVLNYPLSYIELIATVFGLISVYLASRGHILTWATGIVNEVFLFFLFFQVQLYADMMLQVYFFVVTIFGWYHWKTTPHLQSITTLRPAERIVWGAAIIFIALITGYAFSRVHVLLPGLFPIPASYPYLDSFVMILSMAATFLLARKKIETWILWISVDVISVILFAEKKIAFLALEYLIFLGLAIYGYSHWKKRLDHG